MDFKSCDIVPAKFHLFGFNSIDADKNF